MLNIQGNHKFQHRKCCKYACGYLFYW